MSKNKLWWISYASLRTSRFLGLFITSAPTIEQALEKAHPMWKKPDVDTQTVRVAQSIPQDMRDRLLTRSEAEMIGVRTIVFMDDIPVKDVQEC